jgi:hypothetical protein
MERSNGAAEKLYENTREWRARDEDRKRLTEQHVLMHQKCMTAAQEDFRAMRDYEMNFRQKILSHAENQMHELESKRNVLTKFSSITQRFKIQNGYYTVFNCVNIRCVIFNFYFGIMFVLCHFALAEFCIIITLRLFLVTTFLVTTRYDPASGA